MPKPNSAAMQIRQVQAEKKQTLSPAQKRFNSLIKKIQKEKKSLRDWLKFMPDLQRKISTEYEPLMQTYTDLQVTLVRRLDEFHGRSSFTCSQNDKISYLICEYCLTLVERQESNDLDAIYTKHSGMELGETTDELDEFMAEAMRDILEEQLGIDLGDEVDLTDPEELARRVAGKVEEREAEQLREKQTKNQTKRQAAQQKYRLAAQKAEQENISKSIKVIYRQLITESHPDRETDPDERMRKTEIMQRVNTAYEKKDLLQLLELQLELEQIDQNHINTIAQDQLKTYNKVLQNQLEQLQVEVQQAELPFRLSGNISSSAKINPEQIMRSLNADIQALNDDVKQLKKELNFLTTVKNMKIWLKNSGLARDAVLPDDLFGAMDDFDLR